MLRAAPRPSRAREAVAAERGVVAEREPRERQRAEHQAEVAQRDVVPAGEGQQVEDDPRQPGGDQGRAVARLDRDEDPGDDLDHADDVHEVLAAAGHDVVDPRREVLRPVDEHVGELVEPEGDRSDGERDPQHHVRLIAGIAVQRRMLVAGRGPGRA